MGDGSGRRRREGRTKLNSFVDFLRLDLAVPLHFKLQHPARIIHLADSKISLLELARTRQLSSLRGRKLRDERKESVTSPPPSSPRHLPLQHLPPTSHVAHLTTRSPSPLFSAPSSRFRNYENQTEDSPFSLHLCSHLALLLLSSAALLLLLPKDAYPWKPRRWTYRW